VEEGSNIVVQGMCQLVTWIPGEKTRFTDGEVDSLWSFDLRIMGSEAGEYCCLQIGRKMGRLSPQAPKKLEDLVKERLDQLGVRCLILRSDGSENWQRMGVLTFDISGEADSGWKNKILTLI
jgi:hypothetical protein